MFIDEHSVWPREEPAEPPEPARSSEGAARLFLVMALVTFLMPFSIGSFAALIRFLASSFDR
ncbi:hypothetical protein [uncultured Sphingomonas sp.]|uniref:hypothetical protein n=1 Tax=uncultured Sphingomonas sp. TaxID=158754 RepID=UPI0035C9AD8A